MSQWPLSAAETELLLNVFGQEETQISTSGMVMKLTVKELVLRQALMLRVERRRMRKSLVMVAPGRPLPQNAPPPLHYVDDLFRRERPDELRAVIKRLRRAGDVSGYAHRLALHDLGMKGLIEQRVERGRFGMTKTKIFRTRAGEEWAATAERHKAAIGSDLARYAHSNPRYAQQLVLASGAIVLLLPGLFPMLDALDLVQRRRDEEGGDGDGGDGGDGDGFDVFSGLAAVAAGSGFDGADGGFGDIGSAFDSIGSDVDSGGGGDGGSDGGSDGGGGCGGGCGGGGGD